MNTDAEAKARELRQESEDRLRVLYEQARDEVTRIRVLDEVLGEKTLKGDPLVPFSSSFPERNAPKLPPSRSGERPSSPTPTRKPHRRSRTKDKGRKSSSQSTTPATGSKPRSGSVGVAAPKRVRVGDVVERVLRQHPGRWLSASEIATAAKGDLKLGSLSTILRGLRRKRLSWLRCHEAERRVWYSLTISEGGTARDPSPGEPPPAGG